MVRTARVVCILMLLIPVSAFAQSLAAPTISNVNITAGNLNVAATPVSGATSYKAEVFVNGIKRAEATSSQPTVTVGAAAVPANTPVVVTVRAANQSVQSGQSAPVTVVTAPPPPTGITGLGGRNQIKISWQPVAGAASYRLTLSNGMTFVVAGTSHTVTGLPTATSFNCIVGSINSAGSQGAPSAPVAVKTANIALTEE